MASQSHGLPSSSGQQHRERHDRLHRQLHDLLVGGGRDHPAPAPSCSDPDGHADGWPGATSCQHGGWAVRWIDLQGQHRGARAEGQAGGVVALRCVGRHWEEQVTGAALVGSICWSCLRYLAHMNRSLQGATANAGGAGIVDGRMGMGSTRSAAGSAVLDDAGIEQDRLVPLDIEHKRQG
ncbi:hypothetical protein ACP70R_005634 [Stipagrostis hirtigluma subsp. patula]